MGPTADGVPALPGSSLRDLYRERRARRRRASSWDTTGGNRDFRKLQPGQAWTIADLAGPGCITHVWTTLAARKPVEDALVRKIVVRMRWDGEERPSVEAPIGDFFGMGHGLTRNFSSAVLAMSPQDGMAFNCFFPMPFESRALLEVENQADNPINLYWYVDWEEYGRPIDSPLRFHAAWNRRINTGADAEAMGNTMFQFGGKNLDGAANYVILDTTGRGHYVGCNYNIHNLRATRESNWWGEGDDMIFIDGEKWPPSLHGTGTEDYFNTAWCPTQEFAAPYHGILLGGGPNWSGRASFYRYHVEDPIMFEKSIRVTIEQGHDNHRGDDISTTAYWYQTEPHPATFVLPPVKDRLPLPDVLDWNHDDLLKCFDY